MGRYITLWIRCMDFHMKCHAYKVSFTLPACEDLLSVFRSHSNSHPSLGPVKDILLSLIILAFTEFPVCYFSLL